MVELKAHSVNGQLRKKIQRGEIGTVEALRVLAASSAQNGYAGSNRNVELTAALFELERLVGLREVKQIINELIAYIEIQQKRAHYHLKSDSVVLHTTFKGNPGTGKTTVARLLGRILKAIQVLPQGHLVEVERADLVGEYVGHTAQRTREKIKQALGGILFIDEAYSLGRGGEKDFGKESIDALVKGMEDHCNEFVLILAGYGGEMDRFMQLNPGLRSRVPIQIHFPDYSIDELMQIAEIMARERHYRLSEEAKYRLEIHLRMALNSTKSNFGNARLVRNILEKSFRRQALRLKRHDQLTRDDLITITATDLAVDIA